MLLPGDACVGPVLVTERSVCAPMAVVADDVLLALFGSLTADDTFAVFVTLVPAKFDGTLYIDVIVAVWPALSVPRLHGYAVAQAPLFEMKARPVGVVSLTATLVAGDGPAFVTATVYVMFCPVFADAGPVLLIERSDCAPTFVVALAALFVLFGSFSFADTVVVFVTLPLKFGDVLYVDVIVAVCPFVSVPRLHGYALVQAPLLETKVRFAGVGSDTVTPVAVDGPLFVTAIVKTTF